MPIAGAQRAGKGSRWQVNAINLRMGKWDCDWKGDDLDTTNFESGGFEQGIIGINVAPWNGSGLWDASIPPYLDPPGIFPRSALLNVFFYTSVTDNVGWFLPIARVFSAKTGAEVRGLVTFESSGKSNSTFTPPVGVSNVQSVL